MQDGSVSVICWENMKMEMNSGRMCFLLFVVYFVMLTTMVVIVIYDICTHIKCCGFIIWWASVFLVAKLHDEPLVSTFLIYCLSFSFDLAFHELECLIFYFFLVVIHWKEPLNDRCHMGIQWVVPVICLHGLYIVTLVCFTGAIHHIEFRFHELKDLWRGILVSSSSIGTFVDFFTPVNFVVYL